MSLSLAQRLAALFTGHPNVHGTHGEPTYDPLKSKWEIKSTARTKKGAPSLALWEQHLAGTYPLGVVPICPDGTCFWASIDIDEYQEDLLGLIQSIEAQKHPLVPCRSKSGGLHLFLFLISPAPATQIVTLLRDIAARLGRATAEIFPKQTSINSERGDVGNWMAMPYLGTTYDHKIREQVGLKKTGAEQTLEEFLSTAEAARLHPDYLRALTTPAASPLNGTTVLHPARGPKVPFSDGPPCLQIMAESDARWATHRNDTLTQAAIYAKRRFPNDWKNQVERFAQDYCRPPLTADEIMEVVKSVAKKNYEYLCKKEPMLSHCDSTRCRARKFGVGTDGDYPRITALRKLDTDPPIWFVDVSNITVELNTEQLQRYDLFQRAVLARGNYFFRSMKQDAWGQLVNAALEHLDIIETGDAADLSAPEVFREHLEDFLTNKRRGKLRDELLSGLPWEDEETHRHYFTTKALMTYLFRQGERRLTRPQLHRLLTNLGGARGQMSIKNRDMRLWWVPSSCVAPTPTPDPRPLPSTPI